MLQGAIAGLAAGGVYAIIAVSMTLMAQLVRVINFSQAAIGMFGAFVSAALADERVPLWLAMLIGVVVGVLISVLIGMIEAKWLAESSISARSAVTVGSLLLLISLSFIMFGTRPMTFKSVISGTAFQIGDVVISQVTLVLVILAIIVAGGTQLLLRKTSIGTQLRAISDRPIAAETLGLPVRALTLGVWGTSGLIVTIVIMLVAPTQTADAISLSMLVIPASAGALLGAFKRVDLALIGGLLLGMIQGATAQFAQLVLLRDWIPLIIIVLFLLWNQRKEVWDAAR